MKICVYGEGGSRKSTIGVWKPALTWLFRMPEGGAAAPGPGVTGGERDSAFADGIEKLKKILLCGCKFLDSNVLILYVFCVIFTD